MYTTMRELRGWTIRGTDGGDAAKVDDILFDDRAWRVRYVVAETGSWLHRHKVLLSPNALGRLRGQAHFVPALLTANEIAHCLPVDADPPVSTRMAAQLGDLVTLATYWVGGFGVPYLASPVTSPLPRSKPQTGDPHLRSATWLMGYHTVAQDGEIGSLEDLLIDDEGWCLRDLVVQTHGWPHHKDVLIAPHWVSRISWAMRTVRIELPRERVVGALSGPSLS
jgi:uncharacterized protein YrrD